MERVIERLCVAGGLQQRLEELNDRQVGQLMFDVVWDEFEIASPAFTITLEATHRLFRSSGGASTGEKRINDPGHLPSCPKCGEDMMHFIGIDEPDYRRCVSLVCRLKIEEPQA